MSLSPSPPSTPSRAADALLDLVQQMTPSKPPDVLRRLRRNLQSGANDVREDVLSLKRRITDLENLPATTARPKKQRKRLNRAAHADDSIADPQTIEERTREKGRHFVVQEALFLLDPDVFTVHQDEHFDPINEFTSDKNRIQGQLRQILRFLPDDVQELRTTELIAGAFTDGMSGQRSNTSNRLRGPSLAKIADDITPFATASGRFSAFAELIGYRPGTDTRDPYYSKLDVPVLYDGWQGEKDLTTLFRNEILLKIYASIIRGPNGADGLFIGKSKRPAAKTVERMYKIRRTVPGAIANCAVLAIWLHSADTQLVEIGDETSINYRERHAYYLEKILDGLANNKSWAIDLLSYWDRVLFPDADGPRDIDGSAGNARLEADENDEDFFSSAPAREMRSTTPPARSPTHRDPLSPLPPQHHRSSPSPRCSPTSSQVSRRRRDRSSSLPRGSENRPGPSSHRDGNRRQLSRLHRR